MREGRDHNGSSNSAAAAGHPVRRNAGGEEQDLHRITVPISYTIIITHACTLFVYIYILYTTLAVVAAVVVEVIVVAVVSGS